MVLHYHPQKVVPYIGTWIETSSKVKKAKELSVVPYIGTWIETVDLCSRIDVSQVVPYIGTWIETIDLLGQENGVKSYLI